ncbi:S4 domain-containing protein [Sphingomonas sp. gentR]|uniref:RNA-binding protein n=1 Tax=Sphingomonas yabuuchiae TaxID=172044 RepID=A0A147ILW7_9SPHN|nr:MULTISPECIES: S4 domain-containing protein [Sphingomonas]APX64858.1 RNA-binding protein [Sphingomonas sp. LK11]KQO50301.1 RNA-binding protein [Sphingomonas sp. Leaf257]KTT96151.1 RNA-binding protein [Sphingomonas yabuuchiae]MBB4609969.1 ribosome-associated heat shock protein Hsp15 [Sphingomonas yabuuchiae]
MSTRAPALESMRLDRFLWWARIAKSRETAQAMACDGHFRMDGRAIDRAHAPVRIGSILTFAHHGQVRVLRVESLPVRRGPPAEGRACYCDLVTSPVSSPNMVSGPDTVSSVDGSPHAA